MNSLFAFLHHIAAFALVAALVVEFVLIRDELSAKSARKILVADLALGVSATVILVVALLSAYPTIQFLSWRGAVRRQQAPNVSPQRLRAIRAVIHWELAGVVFIILFAVLMARGIG